VEGLHFGLKGNFQQIHVSLSTARAEVQVAGQVWEQAAGGLAVEFSFDVVG